MIAALRSETLHYQVRSHLRYYNNLGARRLRGGSVLKNRRENRPDSTQPRPRPSPDAAAQAKRIARARRKHTTPLRRTYRPTSATRKQVRSGFIIDHSSYSHRAVPLTALLFSRDGMYTAGSIDDDDDQETKRTGFICTPFVLQFTMVFVLCAAFYLVFGMQKSAHTKIRTFSRL